MSDDLISRKKAYKVLTEYYHHRTEMQHKALRKALDRVPSIDIDLSDYSDRLWRNAYEQGKADAEAEIIHCRECKWYDITHPYGTVNPDAHHCKANDRFYGWDHFCAYGERKDDAEV